jgi:hypothetical protein
MKHLLSDDLLTLRAVPVPYSFLGDSHAAVFDGLLFSDNLDQKRYVLSRATWQPYFRGSDLFTDGQFGERFTRSLLAARCLAQSEGEAKRFFPSIATGNVGEPQFENVGPLAPHERVLVMFCGNVDVRDLSHRLRDGADYDIGTHADLIGRLPTFESVGEIDRSHVIEALRECLNPIFLGLRTLRQIGFQKLFLHSLPPPGLLPQTWGKPVRLRYKITILANQLFAEFCAENDVAFLDIWDDVTTLGLRNMDYDLDDTHLNLASATVTMNRLEELLRART